MTEEDWLTCDIPGTLLAFILRKQMSAGKVHLYEEACERIDRYAAEMSQLNWSDIPARDVLHDIFGNPFRPVTFSPSWRTNTAVVLAQQMYESRDFSAMPILADALQDAGCANETVLRHCRDTSLVHVRGCWVVDEVLGKT
jgi:hypothetical protein